MILSDNTATHGYTEESILRPHPLHGPRKRYCCHPGGDGFTIIATCFFILTTAITVVLIIDIYYGSPEVTPHGAVATDDEECSRVGAAILRGGGSAVDVTVASTVCLMVVHPHTVGPGGSGVMLIHDHKVNTTTVLDFFTAIPSSYNHQDPPPGPTEARSVGIPGLVAGLEYAHRKFGKLPWARLIRPSIEIARRGFNVSAQLEDALTKLNITKSSGDTLFEHFFFPQGHMLKKGDFIQRENFAEFLDILAIRGANTFYSLDFDKSDIEIMEGEGATVRPKDFRAYKVREMPSLHMTIRNHTIHTSPPLSGGPQLLAALDLLQHANITTTTPQQLLYLTFIQAIRTSYAHFIHFGVMRDLNLNETQPDFDAFEESFDVTDAPLHHLPEQAASPISVMDTNDQYVSTVVGLGTHFGSRYMTRHGILFNNHLTNLIATAGLGYPLTRPLTPYTPVIITDADKVCGGRVVLSSPEVGAVVQVVGQLVFRNKQLIDAIKERRVTVNPDNNLVLVDDLRSDVVAPLPGDVRNYLEAHNNTFRILYPPYAAVNGITKDKDSITSWSDTRGGGVAHRLDKDTQPPSPSPPSPTPSPTPVLVTLPTEEPQMLP